MFLLSKWTSAEWRASKITSAVEQQYISKDGWCGNCRGMFSRSCAYALVPHDWLGSRVLFQVTNDLCFDRSNFILFPFSTEYAAKWENWFDSITGILEVQTIIDLLKVHFMFFSELKVLHDSLGISIPESLLNVVTCQLSHPETEAGW